MKDKEASVSEISRQTPGELMKCLSQFLLLGALIPLSVKGVRAQTPEDPLVKELENRQNASDVEEGNRRAGMKSFSADDLKP